MSNYSVLKQDINNNIYENQTQQITGTVLNAILNEMTASLGAGYQFAGVATLGMNPGDPDQRVFYLAGEGIYTNFGGIQVPAGKLGVLKWDNRWTLQTIDGLGGGGANLTGYVSVASTDDLPDEGQPTLGYLCGTNLYLYVGEGGDTKEGKYQDCGSFRGPQGDSVQDVEQTQTSLENGGVNKIKFTLSNGISCEFQVRNGTTSSGLFPTVAALQAAYPNPVVGQYAFVGSGFPADIYVCTTAGTWTDSGEDYDGDNVDLTDYATKAEVEAKLIKLVGFGINGTAAGVTTLGDICYNTNTKLLRKWTTGSTPATGTYETVPYYDGAVYTCGGRLYVWDGSNLVSKEEELGKKLKDYETIVVSANVHNSATPAPASASNPTGGEDWDGHLVQSNNGQIVANANYRASSFIPVVGGTAYKSNTKLRTVAFYTAEKNFIALSGRENVAANTQITAPSGASFIRFSYVVYPGSPSPSGVKFGKYDQEINVDFQRVVKIDNFVLDGNNIEDSAVTNEKIKDGTITNEKMKFPLPIVLSNNLFDKDTMVDDNHYIGNRGNYASASDWSCTIPIEIEPNTDYYFYASSWGRTMGYVWYNDNMLPIDGSTTGVDTIAGVHRSPLSAKYVRFNLKSGGVDSTNVMLAKSSQAIPYVDYGQAKLPTSGIDNFENEVRRVAGVKLTKLNVTKDGLSLTIGCGNDYVKFNLENTGNPVCNIVKRMFNNIENNATDDIAPMHILGTTLGANHAQPIQKATITAHGLTNADIGTEWVNGNSVKFYPVKIVDVDNILFLSENTRTYLDPIRVKLAQGNTLTRNGNVLTVESVTDTQMWPGVKNHIVNVYCDDSAISQDGTFQCDKCIVSEQYEIMNPESVLQNLIESAGNPDAPVYDGNSAVSVANLYVFDGSITMGVINTVTFLEAIRFADIMSTQFTKLPGGSISFYVPNSTPIAEGVDLRTPTVVNWSSNIPLCYITQDKAFNPEYPVNRILQYGNNIGYAIGYITDLAVGRKLNKYTTQYFEIRNDTGKIYPHPVNNAKTSSYQSVGNTYTSVMYVAPFVPESQNNGRMNLYTVKVEGCVYVFVDYRSSLLDKVVIDNAFNGKEITVLESSNAELVVMDNNNGDEITNNIYNNGFYVKATYVEGETCYLVAKIK